MASLLDDLVGTRELRGKKVSFGPAGSASSLTGTIVFQRLDVQVEQVLYDNPTALQKLKTGELAALVRVIGRPIDFFAKIPANSGLHFVPIPFSKTFADYYALGALTSKEYPTLVPDGQPVDRGSGGACSLQLVERERSLPARCKVR